MTASAEPIVAQVVTFGRCLREAGLEVGPGRLGDALTGLAEVDVGNPDDVYWTLRTTLVTKVEEIEAFDRAFRAWFMRSPTAVEARGNEAQPLRRPGDRTARREAREGGAREGEETTEIGWSAHELLRQKDFAAMTPEEFSQLRSLLRELASRRPQRRSRRLRPHHRGRVVDLRRLVRRSLATGGDPVERAFRRRAEVPRKLVVLCDVSGSMEKYTRPLLLFLHAVVGSGSGVEVFAFGTRLTRLTRPAWSTGRQAPGLVTRSRRTTTSGGGGRSRAEPSSSSSPTAGSGTTPVSWPGRWRGSRGPATRSSGSTR
jgi:uncharacterized protein